MLYPYLNKLLAGMTISLSIWVCTTSATQNFSVTLVTASLASSSSATSVATISILNMAVQLLAEMYPVSSGPVIASHWSCPIDDRSHIRQCFSSSGLCVSRSANIAVDSMFITFFQYKSTMRTQIDNENSRKQFVQIVVLQNILAVLSIRWY